MDIGTGSGGQCLTHAIGGFGNLYGGVIAAAAVAEKGQLNVEVEVASPGGHSSIPPDHTVR